MAAILHVNWDVVAECRVLAVHNAFCVGSTVCRMMVMNFEWYHKMVRAANGGDWVRRLQWQQILLHIIDELLPHGIWRIRGNCGENL